MVLLSEFNKLQKRLLDLFFPPHCIGCGKYGSFICLSCKGQLSRVFPPVCRKCGHPLDEASRCRHCQKRRLQIDGIRSVLRFEGLAHDAIIKLKFKGFRALAQPLAEQMYDYLKLDPLPVDVLIPVPLSRRRLRERGYNQSALLARELSRLVKLPVTDGVLVRSAYTRAQTEMMTAEERFKNVTDSFKCINIIGSRSVLLIDDVVTTGATLNACAGSLSKAGATSVWGLTVAREI